MLTSFWCNVALNAHMLLYNQHTISGSEGNIHSRLYWAEQTDAIVMSEMAGNDRRFIEDCPIFQ